MDKAKLAHIPGACGVYIFKDKKGGILYIGKANSLKKRVRYYFTRPLPSKIEVMASKIESIEYIVTKTEKQARIKEAELIRENLPVYNTLFRDDKTFPLICISKEKFPIVWVARSTSKRFRYSKFRCFGPYPDAGLLRSALKSIRHIFGFRSCWRMPAEACLYYRLLLCPAPCIGKISARKYNENISNIILFLQEKRHDLIKKLTASMHDLSSGMKFEEAARLRDQIQALSSISTEENPALSNAFRESLDLKKCLGLKFRPKRIEAFDVSNISGSSACACMVSFYEGRPDKNNYRRFRIKSVSGIDDYRMLEEAVARRYRRLKEEKLPLPDLIIVDGGKGQLAIVGKKLQALGLKLPLISIAKPPRSAVISKRRQKEKVFILGRSVRLKIKEDSPSMLFIRRIRDEAHRFAVAYYHILRRKKIIGK
ncbi:MAG: GIY-YIG nuclease family protein [Candidatus Omnitrophica bacterium]|nr:GIY-YIG nuclease family protein [Candidatus Omnitrophota bacterium]